jgi:large subunit ribosomal protein L9
MATEVILKTRIEGLGAEADVVSVKNGYARNYLIPQGFALPATAASKRQIEELKKQRAQREADEMNAAQEFAGKLGKLNLQFTLSAGSGQEKVFGSVTAQDIADKIKEAGFEVDRRKIDLPKGLKDLGEHAVPIKLHHEILAQVKVTISKPVVAGAEEIEPKAKGAKKAPVKKAAKAE